MVKLSDFHCDGTPEEIALAIDAARKRRKKLDRKHKKFRHWFDLREFMRAQNYRCALCGKELILREASLDCVMPLVAKPQLMGNVFLTHNRCNVKKGCADPWPCESIYLEALNLILGWDGITYRNTKKGRRLTQFEEELQKYAPDRKLRLKVF